MFHVCIGFVDWFIHGFFFLLLSVVIIKGKLIALKIEKKATNIAIAITIEREVKERSKEIRAKIKQRILRAITLNGTIEIINRDT